MIINHENFAISFVAMGQGDCTMIRCPDGKVVVIDCGSTSHGKRGDINWVYEAITTIRSTAWAGNHHIDALILTHPDRDHTNQLKNLLRSYGYLDYFSPSTGIEVKHSKLKALSVGDLYFSSAHKDGPLVRYKGLGDLLANNIFTAKALHEVTINNYKDNSKNFVRTWKPNDGFKNFTTQKINATVLNILKGTTNNGKSWRVAIIAGNVPKNNNIHDPATEVNAMSLVTLLEFDGKKALFCGDATFSTEEFLVNAHSNLIKGLDFCTMPHHGSENASSSKFALLTQPKHVIGSSEFYEHNHFHPVNDVAKRWKKNLAITSHDRYIDVWKKGMSTKEIEKIHKEWEEDEEDIGNSGFFYYLEEPYEGVIGICSTTNGGNTLHRIQTDKSIALTAFGTQMGELNTNGFVPQVIR